MFQNLGRVGNEDSLLITVPDRFFELFEHSPWVVERAFVHAPFADAAALHQALLRVVDEAGETAQLTLIRAHPELAAREVPLTQTSGAEQEGAGLRTLSAAEYARFAALNAAYGEKFGHPFIICVRLHNKAGILDEFARRLQNAPATERAAALAEIGKIAWLRLADMALA
jgi:2-oxo-4-hydroxy-4-carboxy-5-ureidoimidazoline decarboxylase